MSWFSDIFKRTVCAHDWDDGWVFANCVQVSIPGNDREPVSWQVMQLCAKCDAMQRRQLMRAEHNAWIDALLANFAADEEHVWVEDLPIPHQPTQPA